MKPTDPYFEGKIEPPLLMVAAGNIDGAKEYMVQIITDYEGVKGKRIAISGQIAAIFKAMIAAMVEYDNLNSITKWAYTPIEGRPYWFSGVKSLSPELFALNAGEQAQKKLKRKEDGRLRVPNTIGLMNHLHYWGLQFPIETGNVVLVWMCYIYLITVTGCRLNEMKACKTRVYNPVRGDFVSYPDWSMAIYSGSRVIPLVGEEAKPRAMYIKVVLVNPAIVSKMLTYFFTYRHLLTNLNFLNEKQDGTTNFKTLLKEMRISDFIEEMGESVLTPHALRCLSASLFYRVHDCKAMPDQGLSDRVCVGMYLGHSAGSGDCTDGYTANELNGTQGLRPQTRVLIHKDGLLCVCYKCIRTCTCERKAAL